MKRTIFLIILLALPFLSNAAEVEYYFEIPGIVGEAQNPLYKNWVQVDYFRYRVPGLESATSLMKSPPKETIGMFIVKDKSEEEKDQENQNHICSFSKIAGKADGGILKIHRAKKRFRQWRVALCTPEGKPFLNFLFKGVTITGVVNRENKLYVTFSFQRVIWNYSHPK